MAIGDNIIKYRELAGLNQKDLAALLGVTPTCLNYYEKNKRSPDVEIIKKMALILNVSGDQLIGLQQPSEKFSIKENSIINKYRKLDTYGKNTVDVVIEAELERMDAMDNIKEFKPETIEIPLYDDKAAAGNGYMFNDNGTEMLTVIKNRITERADFIITVSGRSMEPEFYDGDKVLVRKQPDVYEGEIGIFTINDSGYIKKKGSNRLISINKEYKDIYVHEYDNFICNGLVIGKLDEEDIVE